MSKQRVTDQELAAIVEQVSDEQGYTFHRIQDGYSDSIPRAVFIDSGGEPGGVPISNKLGPLMRLVGRLAADLKDARGARPAPPSYAEALAEVAALREDAQDAAAKRAEMVAEIERLRACPLAALVRSFRGDPATPDSRGPVWAAFDRVVEAVSQEGGSEALVEAVEGLDRAAHADARRAGRARRSSPRREGPDVVSPLRKAWEDFASATKATAASITDTLAAIGERMPVVQQISVSAGGVTATVTPAPKPAASCGRPC